MCQGGEQNLSWLPPAQRLRPSTGGDAHTGAGSCILCRSLTLCEVSVLLVKHPVKPVLLWHWESSPVPRWFGWFWLPCGSCHKSSARARGWSQRVASAEHLPSFVLIAAIYN